VYWTTAAGLLIVQALFARARRTPSAPGDTKLEVVWAIIPALFLVCLGLLSHRSLNENAPTRTPIALQEMTDSEIGLTAVSRTADGGAR
jgi:heme/copper-type cytochrome/quinol oxidase subunit 2